MRHHDECQAAIEDALAADKPGLAEYLATRCDLRHDIDTHASQPSSSQPSSSQAQPIEEDA